jgi:hypothetical protein
MRTTLLIILSAITLNTFSQSKAKMLVKENGEYIEKKIVKKDNYTYKLENDVLMVFSDNGSNVKKSMPFNIELNYDNFYDCAEMTIIQQECNDVWSGIKLVEKNGEWYIDTGVLLLGHIGKFGFDSEENELYNFLQCAITVCPIEITE